MNVSGLGVARLELLLSLDNPCCQVAKQLKIKSAAAEEQHEYPESDCAWQQGGSQPRTIGQES